MSSSLRRGALAATVLAFSLVTLAGCGVGSNAQTLEITPDNAQTAVGTIKVQNALIITQPNIKAKGPAVVSARLFNNGRTDEVLESVTLPGSGAVAELTPAKGTGRVTVPAGGSVLLGGAGNPSAVLPSGREAVQDGSVQQVIFTLSRTGQVKLNTFVVAAKSYFSKFGPSTVPSPSSTPSPSPTAKGKPSGTPSSGAPTASPGASSGSPAPSGSASAKPSPAKSAQASPGTAG